MLLRRLMFLFFVLLTTKSAVVHADYLSELSAERLIEYRDTHLNQALYWERLAEAVRRRHPGTVIVGDAVTVQLQALRYSELQRRDARSYRDYMSRAATERASANYYAAEIDRRARRSDR